MISDRPGRTGWAARFLRRVAPAFLVLVIWPGSVGALATDAGDEVTPAGDAPVELTLFWGDGCPYCEAERRFLDELQLEQPDLVVEELEVWNDERNRAVFRERAAAAGIDARAVPTTFVGDRVWVGFDDVVERQIRAVVEAQLAGREPPAEEDRTEVDVPFVGAVDVGDRSLVVATLLIGFVDGINPCSLWVLSILLAIVLHSGSRRRVMTVGAVFLLVTSAMYGLFIVGLYSALSYASYLPWVQRAVAVIAGTLGVVQLVEVFGPAGGPRLGIPDAAKPGLYRRMRRLAAPDRSLPAAVGTTAALAVGVSLLETPCTLGLPILWTDLLARRDVPATGAVVLFLLYLGAFLLDELIVFGVVVATMRATKLQERHGRELKIISGSVMLTLAGVMLWRPETMEGVGGALAVFVLAVVVGSAGILLDRARHRPRHTAGI